MVDLSKAVRLSRDALRTCNYSDIRKLYKVAQLMYHAMIQQYDYADELNDVKQQYRICELIDQEVLPKLRGAISDTKSKALANDIYELHKLFFALSSRRILKNFALYMEQYKRKKVWTKTLSTMECVFSYSNEFSISPIMNLMRVSCMPGLGKSYFGNLFIANYVGNNPNKQVLRITYSDDLAKITTRQTKSIINSQAYREIFPSYMDKEGDKIFRQNDKYSFCLCDCEDEYNLFSFTREGQANGKRGQLVVIDDLLKGQVECNSIQLHKDLVERYYSDWSSRADDDKQKTLLLGTMWADTDLLNVMYDKAREKGLTKENDCEWAEITKDRSGCFIRIPALDRNNKSTCPLRYSTSYLLEIKAGLTRFLWMAVYQQDPIAPDGLEFNYNVLLTYEKAPSFDEAQSRYASLDPARKGKNFVSMPICYKIEEKHYLVDFLYQKKAMKELYDVIVDKIIQHRINILVVENNTDTSLKEVLDTRLKARGYLFCTIIEKYSSQNKEQRIKDHQSDVRNYVVFPPKGMYSLNTDFGQAIEEITAYSFNYPNKYDDGIDALVIYAMQFIDVVFAFPKIGTFERGVI
ncbi:phage terminase large subunit [Amedibacillus sp. YH-ame6]